MFVLKDRQNNGVPLLLSEP